jgi:hypothetical protein
MVKAMATTHSASTSKTAAPAGPSREAGDLPWCPGCGTDEFLIFEEYVPPRFPSNGEPLLPASASYSCSMCGAFAAHTVPTDWVPPHWFWYS